MKSLYGWLTALGMGAFLLLTLLGASLMTVREAKTLGHGWESLVYRELCEFTDGHIFRALYFERAAETGDEELAQIWLAQLMQDRFQPRSIETPAYSSAILRVDADTHRYIEDVDQKDNYILFRCCSDEDCEQFVCYTKFRFSEHMSRQEEAELVTMLSMRSRLFYTRLQGVFINGSYVIDRIDYGLPDGSGEFTELWRDETPTEGKAVTMYAASSIFVQKAHGSIKRVESQEKMEAQYLKSLLKAWDAADELETEMQSVYIAHNFKGPDNRLGTLVYGYGRDLFESTFAITTYLPDPYSGWEYDENGEKQPDSVLAVVTMTRFSPILSAAKRLKTEYIIIFCVFVILETLWPLLLRKLIKLPMEETAGSARTGRTPVGLPHLREYRELSESLAASRERERSTQAELKRLTRSIDYARQAEDKRRELTRAIAHELKTPLAVIHSYAEALGEDIAPKKRTEYTDVIMDETQHMDAIVLDMLDLSRLEAGKTRLSRTEFLLDEAARTALARLSRAMEIKKLKAELRAGEGCNVSADRTLVEQAIGNYLTNAIRHTPSGGCIVIEVSRDGGRRRLSVFNEGEHIPPGALGRVWESFYRADESRGREGGTGLGLAIVKSTIELHGGTVGAVNREGGVEFFLELPGC